MAALLDNNQLTYVSFPIVKVDRTDDGDLLVWGKATDGSVDSDEQIVDPDWSGKALGTWLKTGGNVRVMHSAQHLPAGKGVEVDSAGGDGHWVRSLVVEPTAKRLVEKGVLQAYSIGISSPRIVRDQTAKGGRIVGGEIHELSLVDRPANKNCGITLVKSAAGTAEDVAELFGEYADLLDDADVAKGEKAKPAAADEGDPADAAEDAADDSDDEATEPDDAEKAYRSAREVWLAREPKPEYGDVPANGTAFLAKRATREAWDRWHAEGETDGLDTPAGYPLWLAKRSMDPNVGGGVDRDKVPAEDFVDSERRRFPIVKPRDVSDAVSSYGRADPPIPMDTFKTRLMAIAHRKGEAYVQELPESWSEKAAAADANEVADADLVKAAKKCPKCGADHHVDSKLRRCESCGAKLPKADKAIDVEISKVGPKGYEHGWVHVGVGAPTNDAAHRHGALMREAGAGGDVKHLVHHLGWSDSDLASTLHHGNEHGPTAETASAHAAVQDALRTEHALRAAPSSTVAAPRRAAGAKPSKPMTRHVSPRDLRAGDVVEVGGRGIRRQRVVESVSGGTARLQGGGTVIEAVPLIHRPGEENKVMDKSAQALPADVQPAGSHREPDGSEVEGLEHDAGMPTEADAIPDKTPVSVKGKKSKPFPGAREPFGANADDAEEPDADDTASKVAAPYAVKRMHDATCAAYPWDAVAAEYPALKHVGDAVVPGFFRDQVTAAAAKGDMTVVVSLAGIAQAADELRKGHVEVEKLDDARALLHKAFSDLYPNTTVHPSSVTPGQFQRPYLSAGHAPMAASASRTPSIPPGTHVPDPDDFNRSLMTAGHEAQSPADTGDNLDTGGSVASGSARTYYRNASREAARAAMQAMHDHIAGTFPDMCPMATSKSLMPPDMGDTNHPRPITPIATATAPGEKAAATDLDKAGPQRYRHGWIPVGVGERVVHRQSGRTGIIQSSRRTSVGGVRHRVRMDDRGTTESFDEELVARHNGPANRGNLKLPPGARKPKKKNIIPDLVKSAVAEATADLQSTYETRITALKAEIDELGAQPDPTQAPLRGVVRKAATTNDDPAPAEKVSLVEAAQAPAADPRAEEAAFVAKFLNHPDPARREQAETRLRRLLNT